MLSEERYSKILEYLKEHKTATVTELAELLETSDSTIRRDLVLLGKGGKLKKIHGGAAVLNDDVSNKEHSVETKEKLFTDEKVKIAKYAASTLRKNDFVFIDAGTTTNRMIDFIEEKDITVVTNGFSHAKKLANKGIKVFILGGQIKSTTEAVIGTECIEAMRKYNFTKCYLGTNGISLNVGFSTPDVDEARVKSEAVKTSYISYVLADHSKFDVVSSVKFADLKDCCIITDKVKNKQYEKEGTIKTVD